MRLLGVELRRLFARRLLRVAVLAVLLVTAWSAFLVVRNTTHYQEINGGATAVQPGAGAASAEPPAPVPAETAPPAGQAPGNPAPGNPAPGNPAPGNPAPGDQVPPGEFPPNEPPLIASGFEFAADAGTGVIAAIIITMLAAFVVGAGFVGAEYAAGTVGQLLMWEPRRLRVAGAKLAAVALGTMAVTAGVVAVDAGLLYLFAAVKGSAAGITGGVVTSLLLLAVRGMALTAAVATVGAGLAMLVRHTAGAVAVGFGYLVALEPVLRGFRPRTQPWLLSTNIEAWLTKEWHGELPPTCIGCLPEPVRITLAAAGGYFAAIVATVTLLAVVAFQRRDVT